MRSKPRAVVRTEVIEYRFAREGRDPTRARGRFLPERGKSSDASLGSGPRRIARVRAMKIAVCVKEVPDATAHKRIDAGTKRLDRSGEGALNAFDANAVEEALRLKDATGEGEVVVVSMGPERALNSLRKALAMGADRAVLSPTTVPPAPISSPRASRSRRRSSASSPTSSSSASSPPTPTAPCSGLRSPSGCSGR